MVARFLPAFVAALVCGHVAAFAEAPSEEWSGTGRWLGPAWYAGPMQDWSVEDGRLVVAPRGGARRFAHLTTRSIARPRAGFRLGAEVRTPGGFGPPDAASAGLALGTKGNPDNLLHAAVYPEAFYPAALTHAGNLRLGEQTLSLGLAPDTPLTLLLTGEETDEGRVRLTLVASAADGREIGRLETVEPAGRLRGVVGVFASKQIKETPANPAPAPFASFANFVLEGPAVENHPQNAFGPVLWTQYTSTGASVRLQAQFPPLEPTDAQSAHLELLQPDGTWERQAEAPIEPASSTALFEIEVPESARPAAYRVAYEWNGRTYHWEGTLRAAPDPAEPWKLGLFSCDNGDLFPLSELIREVEERDPALLFFAGDQFYEHCGRFGFTRSPRELARLDYLRKWFLFGWTNRDILKDRPSVIIPDDHDVFQGNIWGQGGRAIPGQPDPPPIKIDPARGGYAMAPDWVNLVERSQTGHLPPPVDPRPVKQGIGVYFTSFTYGGVSFAVLEDRKFKVGPTSEEAKQGDETLLGERQVEFLDRWALDWSGGATMKVVLSQTIFAQPVTHANPKLEKIQQSKDNNAWPVAGRNRALVSIRRAGAFSLHGDQHLALQLRQGIDDWEDAGVAFMGPATVAGFPRAWWPGGGPGELPPEDKLLGRHEDNFGNKMTIDAVANPTDPSSWTRDPLELAMAKGSGYAMVEFDPAARTMTTHCYPLPYPVDPARLDNGEYKGWPLTNSAADNDGRKPAGKLPLQTFDLDDPVVAVFDHDTGELIYARRIEGRTFEPPVFSPGSYEVRFGADAPDRTAGIFSFAVAP